MYNVITVKGESETHSPSRQVAKRTHAALSNLKLKGERTMSRNELIKRIEYLRELEDMEAEIKAEAEMIRDSLKAEMADREIEEMVVGNYIVRWTSVLSNRFDTTGFKKLYGDLYKAFTKQTNSRRFSISC